ncbi:hypothetical protein ACXYVX_03765 [Mesomycoplasma ovipneumoniae]
MEKIRVKDDPRYQNLKKKHRAIQAWLLKKLKEEYKNKELKQELILKNQNGFKNKEFEELKEIKELLLELKELKKNQN